MTRVMNWRGAAWLLACTLVVMMAATLLSTQRAEAETIHDVVSETWPAPLVPTAEQIAYHEGGGIVRTGTAASGCIPSTQAKLRDQPTLWTRTTARQAYKSTSRRLGRVDDLRLVHPGSGSDAHTY